MWSSGSYRVPSLAQIRQISEIFTSHALLTIVRDKEVQAA